MNEKFTVTIIEKVGSDSVYDNKTKTLTTDKASVVSALQDAVSDFSSYNNMSSLIIMVSSF